MTSAQFLQSRMGPLGLAVLLHLALFINLKIPKFTTSLIDTVKMQIIETPHDVALSPTRPSQAKNDTRTQVRTKAPTSNSGQAERRARYEKLIPDTSLSVLEDAGYGQGRVNLSPGATPIRGEKLAPVVQMPADHWSSRIQIPLRWRKEKSDARAIARIALDENEILWIRSLNGEPVLRAVLYAALKEPDFVPYILQVMEAQRRREFTIVLKFVQAHGNYRVINNEASVYEDGLEVVKTMPPPMKSFGGIDIEDEHSRKAKKIESLQMEKITESPAFAKSLTDVILLKAKIR